MPARTLYDILQISPSAHPAVVEAAYRALMKRHHPDQAGAAGDAALAVIINDAYAVLRQPDRRAEYDRRLEFERRDRAARVATFSGPAPAPQRRFNLFGWSGWLVALTVTAVLANVQRPAAPGAAALPASATQSGEGESWSPARSQPDPSTLDQGPVEPSLSAELPTTAEPAPGQEEVVFTPEPTPEARSRAVRQQRAEIGRAARAQQRRSPRPATRERDAEFLEREGYIY